ncbi:MAG: hypothetical protein ABIL09_22870 [Gemmatimonadota bacterium]
MRRGRFARGALAALVVLAAAAGAQEYGARLGTVQRGGRVSFEPSGPGVLFDALDPVVRRWYVPQELYAEYRWKQWEYSNYARDPYQRYVATHREGDYFYDLYGNYLTRGWLVYDWRQTAPQPFGSSLEKTGQYQSWFSKLVIASDHKGQYHYAITVGDEIRTTLTPMTFSKPLFNGLQWDFSSDKWQLTAILSRISQPSPSSLREQEYTNATNLFGGRVVAQVGDFARVGATLVNAHHTQTQLEALSGNLFQGQLTEAQNFASIGMILVRISDDSPEDGVGGGALFSADILITDLEGNEIRGSEIGFRPAIEGGYQYRGYLAADGFETIGVRYDFMDPTYTGPAAEEIRRVRIELVLANDYLVEMTSDAQLTRAGSMAFLPVAQATGNVVDGSNQRVMVFDYGLPTANQVAGFTLELTDLAGFDAYLELDVNQRYRQYPNPNVTNHQAAAAQSMAWLANVSQRRYPFFAFLEAYDVDPSYTTAMVVTDATGITDYANQNQRYEFVEDNDDQDRYPDWRRSGWAAGDDQVYPGWDENNDFISDFNQNDNEDSPSLVPDYEEPFLRYYTDRPEYLYGVDMNHNGTVDRFENDQEADYPYRLGQRGMNIYAGAFLLPDLRLSMGHLRVRQPATGHHNRAWYLLLNLDRSHARLGRLRLFQDLRRVRDTIADDLLQWTQRPNTRGSLVQVDDVLPARNTWVSATWVGWELGRPGQLRTDHRLMWRLYRQQDPRVELGLAGLRQGASLLGLIDKAEYGLALGRLTLSPRWKSELRRETPVLAGEEKRLELTELLMLIGRLPVMHRSFVEAGVEYERFYQLHDPVPPGQEASSRGLTGSVQLSNISDYMGYRVTTIVGFEVARLDLEYEPAQTRTRGFITLYAAAER